MPKVVSRKPKVGSLWRAKLGRHIGMEGRVVHVGATMVFMQKTYGTVNGSSKRGGWIKLPIDAFWRKYEQV
jgi:hypothetical protein